MKIKHKKNLWLTTIRKRLYTVSNQTEVKEKRHIIRKADKKNQTRRTIPELKPEPARRAHQLMGVAINNSPVVYHFERGEIRAWNLCVRPQSPGPPPSRQIIRASSLCKQPGFTLTLPRLSWLARRNSTRWCSCANTVPALARRSRHSGGATTGSSSREESEADARLDP